MDGARSGAAPFPYFGGKSRAASLVWGALGRVNTHVEPFCGSAAVLLARPEATFRDPGTPGVETVNDASGMIANFWRAVRYAPAEVAAHCDQPVVETDLHARHRWLVAEVPRILAALDADPEWYDAKAAGWWCWGACCWIGSGWCPEETRISSKGKRPDLSHAGKGGERPSLSRQLPSLSDGGAGVHRPRLSRQLPYLGGAGRDQSAPRSRGGVVEERVGFESVAEWLEALSARLRRVRVACGDWQRVVTGAVLFPTSEPDNSRTGVFLDPPYGKDAKRTARLYARDSLTVAADARAWCLAHGTNPRLRIVLAGEVGEHEALAGAGWRAVPWKRQGGYSGGADRRDERLWLSPHCHDATRQPSLFPEAL